MRASLPLLAVAFVMFASPSAEAQGRRGQPGTAGVRQGAGQAVSQRPTQAARRPPNVYGNYRRESRYPNDWRRRPHWPWPSYPWDWYRRYPYPWPMHPSPWPWPGRPYCGTYDGAFPGSGGRFPVCDSGQEQPPQELPMETYPSVEIPNPYDTESYADSLVGWSVEYLYYDTDPVQFAYTPADVPARAPVVHPDPDRPSPYSLIIPGGDRQPLYELTSIDKGKPSAPGG
jgi:hypothetical protein